MIRLQSAWMHLQHAQCLRLALELDPRGEGAQDMAEEIDARHAASGREIADMDGYDLCPLIMPKGGADDVDFHACVLESHGPIMKIVQAVARSGCRLDFFRSDAEGFAMPWASTRGPTKYADLVTAFRGLTGLRLHFDGTALMTDDRHGPREVEAFIRLLQQLAPQLQRLALSPKMPPDDVDSVMADSGRFDQMCTRLCRSLEFPNLPQFSMISVAIGYADLRTFLIKHSKSLEDFFLVEIDVEVPGVEHAPEGWGTRLMDDLKEAGFPFDRGTLEIYMEGED